MASPGYAPRLNSWVTAAFALLFGLTSLVWLFGPSLIDQGAPLGPYAGTAWELVYAWVTLPTVGELVIAYIADRLVRERGRKKAKRAPGLLGALATAAGVLGYAILFVAAIPIAAVIFFQSLGMLNPDAPIALWMLSVLFGLLVGACILLGSQLPSVDRSLPEYKLYQDGSPASKRD